MRMRTRARDEAAMNAPVQVDGRARMRAAMNAPVQVEFVMVWWMVGCRRNGRTGGWTGDRTVGRADGRRG